MLLGRGRIAHVFGPLLPTWGAKMKSLLLAFPWLNTGCCSGCDVNHWMTDLFFSSTTPPSVTLPLKQVHFGISVRHHTFLFLATLNTAWGGGHDWETYYCCWRWQEKTGDIGPDPEWPKITSSKCPVVAPLLWSYSLNLLNTTQEEECIAICVWVHVHVATLFR